MARKTCLALRDAASDWTVILGYVIEKRVNLHVRKRPSGVIWGHLRRAANDYGLDAVRARLSGVLCGLVSCGQRLQHVAWPLPRNCNLRAGSEGNYGTTKTKVGTMGFPLFPRYGQVPILAAMYVGVGKRMRLNPVSKLKEGETGEEDGRVREEGRKEEVWMSVREESVGMRECSGDVLWS